MIVESPVFFFDMEPDDKSFQIIFQKVPWIVIIQLQHSYKDNVVAALSEKANKFKNNHLYLTASSPKNLHRLGGHLKSDCCEFFKY